MFEQGLGKILQVRLGSINFSSFLSKLMSVTKINLKNDKKSGFDLLIISFLKSLATLTLLKRSCYYTPFLIEKWL